MLVLTLPALLIEAIILPGYLAISLAFAAHGPNGALELLISSVSDLIGLIAIATGVIYAIASQFVDN